MKKELDREMAQGFLSPSAEGDSEIPPMSPILKSPSIDAVTVRLKCYTLNRNAVPYLRDTCAGAVKGFY